MSETLVLTPHEHVTVLEHTSERLVVEVAYAPGGSAPPVHVHPEQDERFEVLEGALDVRLGDERRTLRAGDVLEVPRGTPHAMAAAGDEAVRARWETLPAGRTLGWFRALAAAQSRPPVLRQVGLVVALARHRDVFRLRRG